MARIPVGPVIEGVKKAGKFVNENKKEIGSIISIVGSVGGAAIKWKKESQTEGKLHPRHNSYLSYKSKILTELDSQNRNELFRYIDEIEQFIQQIRNEKNKEFGVKKPIHRKGINNWNDILTQIKDKMSTKDYLEFIMIYNNPNYQSGYFRGFEGYVEKFKKLNNVEDYDNLLKFIAEMTNRNIERIKKDFLLEA
jgi:hypothetical protein